MANLLAERGDAAAAEIELQDAVGALDADIERHAVDRERLAVEQLFGGDRLAVAAEHRRRPHVSEACQRFAAVGDAAGEPVALVVHGDETFALRVDAKGRQATEPLE